MTKTWKNVPRTRLGGEFWARYVIAHKTYLSLLLFVFFAFLNHAWRRALNAFVEIHILISWFIAHSEVSILRPWQTRTHCCGHIVADTSVSSFARAANICCGHKFCVRDTKNVSDFLQKHFVSATNVSHFAQHKKHHEQQCVCNNVSLFARAFRKVLM